MTKEDFSPLKLKPRDYPVLLREATKDFLWSKLKGHGGFAGKSCFPLNLCSHTQVTIDLAFTVIPVLVVVWVLDWRSLPNYLWHFETKEGPNPHFSSKSAQVEITSACWSCKKQATNSR